MAFEVWLDYRQVETLPMNDADHAFGLLNCLIRNALVAMRASSTVLPCRSSRLLMGHAPLQFFQQRFGDAFAQIGAIFRRHADGARVKLVGFDGCAAGAVVRVVLRDRCAARTVGSGK